MSLYIIDYDLSNPGQNYTQLSQAIRAYRNYAKICESSWCIRTTNSSAEIRDNLKNYIDSNDKLFVAELSGSWASYGLPKETADWLKE